MYTQTKVHVDLLSTTLNQPTWRPYSNPSTRLCDTREWVKREEKEILQHQTTSLYIQFVCHPRTVSRALMYHSNPFPWSYTPPIWLLSTQPRHLVQCRNISNHFPYHIKFYCHYHVASSHRLHISECLRLSVTPVSSETIPLNIPLHYSSAVLWRFWSCKYPSYIATCHGHNCHRHAQ